MAEYGALPALDTFDSVGKKATFTTVGYGVQRMFPEAAAWKIESQRLRMVATPRLLQVNSPSTGDYSMLLSVNANTGGACLGDSGGPNFIGDSNVVGAVTSSSKSDICASSTPGLPDGPRVGPGLGGGLPHDPVSAWWMPWMPRRSGRAVAQLGDVARDRRVEAEPEREVGGGEVGERHQ